MRLFAVSSDDMIGNKPGPGGHSRVERTGIEPVTSGLQSRWSSVSRTTIRIVAESSKSGAEAIRGPRCKGKRRDGQPCQALAGVDGLCAFHSGRLDPREMGRKGGSVGKGGAARRRAVLESTSLREKLRELDPDVITAACSEILAGSNGAAKVSVRSRCGPSERPPPCLPAIVTTA